MAVRCDLNTSLFCAPSAQETVSTLTRKEILNSIICFFCWKYLS